MAISSGVRPHTCDINGFLITEGTVELTKNNTNNFFNVSVPMSLNGALSTFQSATDATVSANGQALIKGTIEVIDFDMIGRTIVIAGSGMEAALRAEKTAQKFTNQSDSNIVSQLVQTAGLSGGGGGGGGGGQKEGRKVKDDFDKLTDGVSIAHAVSKIADREGKLWFVDGQGNFNYGSSTGGGSVSINYSATGGAVPQITADCLRLVIEMNPPASSAKVEASSWNPHDKQAYSAEGSAGAGGGEGGSSYSYHVPEMDQEHLKTFAQGKANEAARHFITIDATVVGDPSITASMSLSLSGTQLFDGTYDIDVVRHNIGMQGYTTDIVAKTPMQQGTSA